MTRVVKSIKNKYTPSHNQHNTQHHNQHHTNPAQKTEPKQNYTINVAQTMDSGQVFLWDAIKDKRRTCWYGINGQDILRIDKKTVSTYRNGKWRRYENDFLRSTDNIRDIIRSFPNDKTMKAASSKYSGLRIMRQDPFQCMISFIVSANSNIQRIRTNLANIAKRFGDCTTIDGLGEFHTFPEPKTLAKAHIHDIQQCGVGYRAKYVVEASKMIASGAINLEDVTRIESYCDAMDAMLCIPGVGRKVADCIMLFSLERLDAFPLDRWMMRVLDKYYGEVINLRRNVERVKVAPSRSQSLLSTITMATKTTEHHLTDKQYKNAHQKITDYFGVYAGYAQQMLFKMARDDSGAVWRQKTPGM